MVTNEDEFGIDWDAEAHRAAGVSEEGYTDTSFFNYFKDIIIDMEKNIVVLEIGCNIANWYITWKNTGDEVGTGITYIGLDFSKDAIEIARKRYNNVQFLYKDARDLDFTEEVDIVFTHTVLQHMSIDRKKIVLPKIWNALKYSGLLIIQENTATISDATWPNKESWINFVEGCKGCRFKLLKWHDIGGGGTGMVFKKVKI